MPKTIRNQDNFINAYTYITEQLDIYDYKLETDIDILEMKLRALDGPVNAEESGGMKFESNKLYFPDSKVIITTDNGPKIYKCNTLHVSGIREFKRLSKIQKWSPNITYKAANSKTHTTYNGGADPWGTYSESYYGDVVSYQDKLYLVVSDFTSCYEFDNGSLDEIESWSYWSKLTDYDNGALVVSNGYLWECTTPHVSGDLFETKPSFFSKYWTEEGDALVWESDSNVPIDHFSSLKNELQLLDLYVRTEEDKLIGNEMSYSEEINKRVVQMVNFSMMINLDTGYQNQDFDFPIILRPPLLTTDQTEEIYQLYLTKKANNELDVPSDYLFKVASNCVDEEVVSAENSLSGFISPLIQLDGIRDASQKMRSELDSKIAYREKLYDELHDLVYSVLTTDPNVTTRDQLSLAKTWRPNTRYEKWDMITSVKPGTVVAGLYDTSTFSFTSAMDHYDTYGSPGHIWICKYAHTSGTIHPTMDNTDDPPPGLGKRSVMYKDPNTDEPIWPFPYWCDDCETNSDTATCSECSGSNVSILNEETIWVRPLCTDSTAFIDSNLTFSPNQDDPHDWESGFIPMVYYHHNSSNESVLPDTTLQDEESKFGVAQTQVDYSTFGIVDVEGDTIPFLLLRYYSMIFKMDRSGYSTSLATPVSQGNPLYWLNDALDNLSLSFVGIEPKLNGTLADEVKLLSIAFMPQRNHVPPQNECCKGGSGEGTTIPEPSDIPGEPLEDDTQSVKRRSHDISKCNTCEFEYDSWVDAYISGCPRCGSNTEQSRTELGRALKPMNCGKVKPWCTGMKIHPSFGPNGTLSPTNAKFASPGSSDDPYCYGAGDSPPVVSDCTPCYGCSIAIPEPLVIPTNSDTVFSYKKRIWKHWAQIATGWICTYLTDPTVIWPGDHRAGESDDEYQDPDPSNPGCGDPSNFWPYNWADAPDAVSGGWNDFYAEPVSNAPGDGYISKYTAIDGHDINTYGDYYGTPEECFKPFAFCRFTDSGECGETSGISTVRDRNNLISRGPGPGPGVLSVERFAILNIRFRTINNELNNKTLAIGNEQIVEILDNVGMPNFKNDYIEAFQNLKRQKINNIYTLTEYCNEWVVTL